MTSTTPIADSPKSVLTIDRRRWLGLRRMARWLLGSDADTLKQQQLMLIVSAIIFLLVAALFNGVFGVTPALLVGIYIASLPMALLVISPVGCLLAELWAPHWIEPYPDAATRLIDLVIP